jgi:hypothetical protein
MTRRQAAEMIGISYERVCDLQRDGILKGERLERFSLASIE